MTPSSPSNSHSSVPPSPSVPPLPPIVPLVGGSETIRVLKDLTAGTIGACSGIVAGQPLDTVKVRMQSNPELYKNALDCSYRLLRFEGFFAFFKGMSSPLIGNAPLNAIVFGCNGNMNRLLDKHFPRHPDDIKEGKPSYWRLFTAAAWGGTVQCIVCTPTELIKCKLQVQITAKAHGNPSDGAVRSEGSKRVSVPVYNGAVDCLRQTVRNNGFFGLYRGWWATIYRDTPSYGVWFVVYEWFKYNLTPFGEKPSTSALLISGSFGGIATWLSTYPYDVIKSIIQTKPDNTPKRELSVMYVGREIYAHDGWKGFWRGIGPTLVRSVPMSAVTFFVYEKCLAALNKHF